MKLMLPSAGYFLTTLNRGTKVCSLIRSSLTTLTITEKLSKLSLVKFCGPIGRLLPKNPAIPLGPSYGISTSHNHIQCRHGNHCSDPAI